MSAHTSFRQGQPVLVHTKDGRQFKDKFQERRSQFVVLRNHGKVLVSDIRAMSIPR